MCKRIFFSACDVGAAQHIAPLIKLIENNSDWVSKVCASEDAGRIFRMYDVEHEILRNTSNDRSTAKKNEVSLLFKEIAKSIFDFSPSITISGLANYRNGPDDLTIKAAKLAGIKTCLLLDDYGPIYQSSSGTADYFLATTRKIYDWATQFPVESVFIGSPKHEALAGHALATKRKIKRDALGIGNSEKLISFIAQHERMVGHSYNFGELCSALDAVKCDIPNYKLIVRPHPGAPDAALTCQQIAKSSGLLSELDDKDDNILDLLAASDCVLTCQSTSIIDYVWFRLGSELASPKPIYLLMGDDINDWLDNFLEGPWRPELIELGMALEPKSRSELQKALIDVCGGVEQIYETDLKKLRGAGNSAKNFLSFMKTV